MKKTSGFVNKYVLPTIFVASMAVGGCGKSQKYFVDEELYNDLVASEIVSSDVSALEESLEEDFLSEFEDLSYEGSIAELYVDNARNKFTEFLAAESVKFDDLKEVYFSLYVADSLDSKALSMQDKKLKKDLRKVLSGSLRTSRLEKRVAKQGYDFEVTHKKIPFRAYARWGLVISALLIPLSFVDKDVVMSSSGFLGAFLTGGYLLLSDSSVSHDKDVINRVHKNVYEKVKMHKDNSLSESTFVITPKLLAKYT